MGGDVSCCADDRSMRGPDGDLSADESNAFSGVSSSACAVPMCGRTNEPNQDAATKLKKKRRASNAGIKRRTTDNRATRMNSHGLVELQMSNTEAVWWEAKETAMGPAVMTTKAAQGSELLFAAGSEIVKIHDISNEKNEQKNVDALLNELQRAREAQEKIQVSMLSVKAVAELSTDLADRCAGQDLA